MKMHTNCIKQDQATCMFISLLNSYFDGSYDKIAKVQCKFVDVTADIYDFEM